MWGGVCGCWVHTLSHHTLIYLHSYGIHAYKLGVSQLRIFIVESEISNLDDSRLIVESYVWVGQSALPRFKSGIHLDKCSIFVSSVHKHSFKNSSGSSLCFLKNSNLAFQFLVCILLVASVILCQSLLRTVDC